MDFDLVFSGETIRKLSSSDRDLLDTLIERMIERRHLLCLDSDGIAAAYYDRNPLWQNLYSLLGSHSETRFVAVTLGEVVQDADLSPLAWATRDRMLLDTRLDTAGLTVEEVAGNRSLFYYTCREYQFDFKKGDSCEGLLKSIRHMVRRSPHEVLVFADPYLPAAYPELINMFIEWCRGARITRIEIPYAPRPGREYVKYLELEDRFIMADLPAKIVKVENAFFHDRYIQGSDFRYTFGNSFSRISIRGMYFTGDCSVRVIPLRNVHSMNRPPLVGSHL